MSFSKKNNPILRYIKKYGNPFILCHQHKNRFYETVGFFTFITNQKIRLPLFFREFTTI